MIMIDGYNIVNHFDGVKTNNYSYNLELTTPKGNNDHAISIGLKNIKGENNGRSILTNEQVHQICKLLEKNIPYSEILKNMDLDNNIIDIITKIRTKHLWKHISDQYDIPEKEYRSKQNIYSDSDIHMICSYIQYGYSNNEIANMMNIDISNDKYRDKYTHFISRIRKRDCFKHISKNYNW